MSNDNTSTFVSNVELPNEINSINNLSTGAISKTSVTNDKTKKHNKSFEDSKLKDWEDSRLKDLLEEAYSYKNPRDKENKSETFLQLLQKAENEKEDTSIAFSALTSRYTRGSTSSANSSHKQGGSLQDVFEAARTESLIDSEYSCSNTNNRRHNHNSRPKKYSSVSYRQREGGSLPSNVNVSNSSLSVYDHPFLNEVTKQRRSKNERTCSGTSCASVTSGTSSTVSTCGHDSLTSSGCKEDTSFNNITHGVAGGGGTAGGTNTGNTSNDMGEHPPDEINFWEIFNDVWEQDKIAKENNELTKVQRAPVNNSSKVRYDYYIDNASAFPQSERGKNFMDNSSLPLNENYKSCKSVLAAESGFFKNQPNPSSLLANAKSLQRQFDINGNAFNVTCTANFNSQKNKKKKSLSERNMKPIDVQKLDGYRGDAEIEDLVKYIENSKDTVSNEKVSKFVERKKDHKKKDKESINGAEKDVKNEIKRSNSLEELRSCTKLDDNTVNTERITGDNVILRNKGNKNKNLNTFNNVNNSINTNTIGNDIIIISKHPNQVLSSGNNSRKCERRSWGTEELTYLGDSHNSEEKNKDKDKRKPKVNCVEKKKIDATLTSMPLKVISMESIAPNESSAEFHVVTKKKKAKKRQNNFDDHVRPNAFTNTSNKRESQQIQQKSRRKSTSSVPPSDKSDSSDLDSVHSLPIESISNRHRNTDQNLAAPANPQLNPPQSYADIARTVKHSNTVITSPGSDVPPDKWSSVDKTSVTAKDNTMSCSGNDRKMKRHVKLTSDFPDLCLEKNTSGSAVNFFNDAASSCSSTSSTSTIIKAISYSQSVVSTVDESPLPTFTPLQSATNADSKPTAGQSKTAYNKNSTPNNSKQTLQRYKNVENESSHNFNSIDQYPALEKTVKQRHVHAQSQHYAPVVTVTNTFSSVVNSQSSNNSIGVTQQERLTLNTKISSPLTFMAQQPLQSCAKNNAENIFYNTSTTSLSSTSYILINNKKANKSTTVKNVNTKLNELPSATISAFAGSSAIVMPNSITTGGITPSFNRKSKKDKSVNSPQQNKSESPTKILSINTNNNIGSCDNTISNNKFSNRPAVIILNDEINNGSSNNSSFTFGDFHKDELLLLEDANIRVAAGNDSGGNFNASLNSQDGNSSHTDLSVTNDQGYSSCNQSMEVTANNLYQNKMHSQQMNLAGIVVSTPAPMLLPKSLIEKTNITNLKKMNFNEQAFYTNVHKTPNDDSCDNSNADMFTHIDYGKVQLLQTNQLPSGPISSTPMQSPPQMLRPTQKAVEGGSNEQAVIFIPAQMLGVTTSFNSSNSNSLHQTTQNNIDRTFLNKNNINNNNNMQFISEQILLPSQQQLCAPSTIVTCSQIENELTANQKAMMLDTTYTNHVINNSRGKCIKISQELNNPFVPQTSTTDLSSYDRSLINFIASEWDKTFNELTTIFYRSLSQTEQSNKSNNNIKSLPNN